MKKPSTPAAAERAKKYYKKYQAKRTKKDPFYKASRSARALLSMSVRRFIESEGNAESPALQEIMKINLWEFMSYIEDKLISKGFKLEDYAKTWELDHTIPLSAFAELAKVEGIDKAISRAFQYENIRPVSIEENRNHALKSSVVDKIKSTNLGKKVSRKVKKQIRENNPNRIPIAETTTNKSFLSINQAAKFFKMDPATLRDRLKTGTPTRTGLVFKRAA